MFRIFWKTTFTTFIILFLLINLSMVFNMISFVSVGGWLGIEDYSNKYFGISSIIDFVSNFSVEDSDALMNMKSVMNDVANYGKKFLYGDWLQFSSTGGIYDIESFFNAIALFFESFLGVLTYIYYFILHIVYFLMVFIFLYFKLVMLLGGFYFKNVPYSPLTLLINFV